MTYTPHRERSPMTGHRRDCAAYAWGNDADDCNCYADAPTCWCGQPATYIVTVDPAVTPEPEGGYVTMTAPGFVGEPAVWRCDDHLGESFGAADPITNHYAREQAHA